MLLGAGLHARGGLWTFRSAQALIRRAKQAAQDSNKQRPHADLIFDICHQVTVLNLGRMLAAGTPAEIRVHKEVVSAYLGG